MKVEFAALNANASHRLCGALIGVPIYFLFGNFDRSMYFKPGRPGNETSRNKRVLNLQYSS